MTFHSITRRLTLLCAVALVAAGIVAPAAQAGTTTQIYGKYGYVKFEAYGETLTAADTYACLPHLGRRQLRVDHRRGLRHRPEVQEPLDPGGDHRVADHVLHESRARRALQRPQARSGVTAAMSTAAWTISIIAIAIVVVLALREFRS
jgi:hypothetical protein